MKGTEFNYKLLHHHLHELESINDREEFTRKTKSIYLWLEWLLSKDAISKKDYGDSIKLIRKLESSKSASNSISSTVFQLENRIKARTFVNLFSFKYIILISILVLILLNIYIYKLYNQLSSDLNIKESQGRILPFKGTIKETDGNPLDTKRDAIFKLYSLSQGGEPLYTGKCIGENALQPLYNGSFTILVGADCGMKPIPENIFQENSTLYLGMTIGQDQELQPRYQIFTTTYSKDTSKLQGLELGKSLSSIPYIDESGMIQIEAENPVFKSTNGIFTIEGNTITLKANHETSGDILIQPGAESKVIIPFGKLGLGTFEPTSLLDVAGTQLFTSAASVRNLANVDDENTSALKLSLGTETTGTKSNFIEFFAGATSENPGIKVGDIRINNEGVVYETAGADFAEYFEIPQDQQIPVGTIVSLSSKGIHPSVQNEKIIGAASTTAGFIGNRKMNQVNSVLIALVGQVNVLVSTINGEIQTGDRVGASAIPGYGGKVGSEEFSVGYVLEKKSDVIFSQEQCPKSYKNRRDPSGKKIQCGIQKILLDLE